MLGLSPFEAGLWTVPYAGAFIVGALLTPLFVRRIRPGFVIAGGLALAGAGFALLAQVDGESALATVVTGSVVFALGLAPVYTLAADLMVGAAPPERAGAAAGISETSSEFGGALGIAVLGAVGTAVYRGQIDDAVPAGVPPEAAEAARDTLGAAVAAGDELPDPLAAELVDAAREAFTQALQVAATLSAAVAIGAAILAARCSGACGWLRSSRRNAASSPNERWRAAARVDIEANGAALYYEEHGDGAPLILIHGGLSSGSQWEPVVPELADGFRVITPDSRGHGRSTNPAGELSYALIADDIAALIAALGLQRPVVGGWSDGGQVTLELGARHPGVAGALIVGAAYPDFEAGLREAHRALLGADETGVPDPAHLDAQLGEFAEEIKALHPGGAEQWRALVHQTAPMWLNTRAWGRTSCGRSRRRCWCSPATGTSSSPSTSRCRSTGRCPTPSWRSAHG